jgi:hypothetical protein
MQHLGMKDWEQFRQEFPSAYRWLLGRSLDNERANLRLELLAGSLAPGRREWVIARLEHFQQIADAFEGLKAGAE